MSEKPTERISPGQQVISSCSGAIITSLFMTPMDVVKIRLQSQQKPMTPGSAFLYCNGLMDHVCICRYCDTNGNFKGTEAHQHYRQWFSRPSQFQGTLTPNSGCLGVECTAAAARGIEIPVFQRNSMYFSGTMDALIKITRYEGVTSLWSGLSPTLVLAVPATMVYFTSYDLLKYAMGYRENDPNTKYIPMIAGSTARVFASSLISPLELIRTKMQSQQMSYFEVHKALQIAVKEGGFLSLMRGLGPSLLRDVPFSAIYWFGYEFTKARELERTGSTELPFSKNFMAGAISGTIAAVLTLPFDVVKTQKQIELGEAGFAKDKKVTSTYTLLKRIYADKGIKGWYTGIVPRIIKVAPACAIMISTYEFCKKFFKNYNAQIDLAIESTVD